MTDGPHNLEAKCNELQSLVDVLSAGKSMWESTFDAITSPLHIISSDYTILRANKSLAKHCQADIRDVIGQKCYAIFAKRRSPCTGCPVKTCFSKKCQICHSINDPINSCEFEVSVYPSCDQSEDWAIVYYRDITQEKKLQREIIQQEKMAAIGILAGGVAHEINNPLGGIIAFTQLLQRDIATLDNNDRLLDDLSEVADAADRCKKIVSDLLDFSRMSGNSETCLFNINDALLKVLPLIRREMAVGNITESLELSNDLPTVRGLPNQIQQVLLNLMTNACHAMPEGGILSIKTGYSKTTDCIYIEVSDQGDGIPVAAQKNIFDPFFTTKDPGKGTGLGLSISYRIVKEHDGEISVDSMAGEGAVFTVSLPVGTCGEN